jgi:hypothetical protein
LIRSSQRRHLLCARFRLAHLRDGDAVNRDDGCRSEEPDHHEAAAHVAESRRTLPEQVHEPEDGGKEEREPGEDDCVGRVVAVGVFGDDGEVRGARVLDLRVDDGTDQQHDWRRD